ncbi:hypothetical protein [Phenylobacterium sp.]|jgi:hypothetical protein|uniref:hypothetical protein n=1 Tax=Phenylobacterium sp. TaxID=1871053 RepID=UPI002E35F858|nr:hypothetical protein [Phenylobacterium sp.]HEX3366694.1 hypothetical protein [Phenylobacterium sp.]
MEAKDVVGVGFADFSEVVSKIVSLAAQSMHVREEGFEVLQSLRLRGWFVKSCPILKSPVEALLDGADDECGFAIWISRSPSFSDDPLI